MTNSTHTTAAIRAAMDRLIDRATNFDVDALETIYHKDFHTTLVMPDSTVATYDKEGFIAHFRKQAEEGKTRLNPLGKHRTGCSLLYDAKSPSQARDL